MLRIIGGFVGGSLFFANMSLTIHGYEEQDNSQVIWYGVQAICCAAVFIWSVVPRDKQ